MYVRIRLFILVLVALVSPSLGNAQQTNARVAPVAGPLLDATVTGIRRSSAQTETAVNMQRRSRQNVGPAVALMIVGGAAIVLGALIGDEIGTLFMVGGAVALLVGLYRYLQ